MKTVNKMIKLAAVMLAAFAFAAFCGTGTKEVRTPETG